MVAAATTQRSASPLQWSPEDVVAFLTDAKGPSLPAAAAAAFSANQIDGAALLELTQAYVLCCCSLQQKAIHL